MLPVGAKLVAPPLSDLTLPSLLHPIAPMRMTNMDTTVNFTKAEPIRFNMVPPVARETGTLDALLSTRGSVLERIVVAGWWCGHRRSAGQMRTQGQGIP